MRTKLTVGIDLARGGSRLRTPLVRPSARASSVAHHAARNRKASWKLRHHDGLAITLANKLAPPNTIRFGLGLRGSETCQGNAIPADISMK